MRRATPLFSALLVAQLLAGAGAEERAHMAALESIRTEEALAHVEVLAGDAMEGRRAGTRGGRAAGAYLAQRLDEMGWRAGGEDGGYFQPFPPGRRNVLALWEGSDERLKNEYIVIGAHYDHVGYGDSRTSFGPIGFIHNGADDNASGVAAVLEFAEAVAQHNVRTRRSVIIALWDGEELGLLGSKHWCAQPTVPLEDVALAINLDMVGRLRDGRLEVNGTRTAAGLRRMASLAVDPGLWLDFTWEVDNNSDHWPFMKRGVPALMLHTGLHDDYHRPSDDIGDINAEGVRLVSRYLFDLVLTTGDADELPAFRRRGLTEGEALQERRERPLPPLPASAPRPRVGLSWREDEGEPHSVFLTRVVEGSPADAAGLRVHDRVLEVDGDRFADSEDFHQRVLARVAEDAPEIVLLIERRGRVRSATVALD